MMTPNSETGGPVLSVKRGDKGFDQSTHGHDNYHCPSRGSEPWDFLRESHRHQDRLILAQGLLRPSLSTKSAVCQQSCPENSPLLQRS